MQLGTVLLHLSKPKQRKDVNDGGLGLLSV